MNLDEADPSPKQKKAPKLSRKEKKALKAAEKKAAAEEKAAKKVAAVASDKASVDVSPEGLENATEITPSELQPAPVPTIPPPNYTVWEKISPPARRKKQITTMETGYREVLGLVQSMRENQEVLMESFRKLPEAVESVKKLADHSAQQSELLQAMNQQMDATGGGPAGKFNETLASMDKTTQQLLERAQRSEERLYGMLRQAQRRIALMTLLVLLLFIGSVGGVLFIAFPEETRSFFAGNGFQKDEIEEPTEADVPAPVATATPSPAPTAVPEPEPPAELELDPEPELELKPVVVDPPHDLPTVMEDISEIIEEPSEPELELEPEPEPEPELEIELKPVTEPVTEEEVSEALDTTEANPSEETDSVDEMVPEEEMDPDMDSE